MLAMIGSIQSQIQILASGYDQLENRVAYLEEQVGILENRVSVMESNLENFEIEMAENINVLMSMFENLEMRMNNLEVWISAVENNVNVVNNTMNDINNRLFLLEQLLKVPSGFPSYTVKVKLIDENSFDIHDEKIWLIMANGRILEGVSSPAVFENVLADHVVIRYKDLRYEFVLNSNTNILIQVKENVAQVLTMVRIVIPNLKEGSWATIIIDGGKYSFWTYENAITVWLPVGEHKIQIFTNDQKGETTLYASHEPEEQTLYLQSSTGVLTWVTPLAIVVSVIVLLSFLGLAWAWSQRRYRYSWR
jgi:hypothetical protein